MKGRGGVVVFQTDEFYSGPEGLLYNAFYDELFLLTNKKLSMFKSTYRGKPAAESIYTYDVESIDGLEKAQGITNYNDGSVFYIGKI